jgi:diguanylate cyclase (GGDEF)-like protein/PAS domain S-box-containing protein
MPSPDNPDLYRHVLEELPTGVYLVAKDGTILLWNRGAERITGYLRQDVLGHACREDFFGTQEADSDRRTAAFAALEAVLRDGKPTDTQVSFRHKAGHFVPVRLRAMPMRDDGGAVIGAVECIDHTTDLAERDRRHSKLAEYGCLDPDTGVLNHKMIETRLREALATHADSKIPFCVLCIAFDHLLELQARYGSGALAAVLRLAGQSLEASLRPTDYLGRWQENEFLAVVTECSRAEIVNVGNRLRKTVERGKITWWGNTLPVTISIGAAAVQANDSIREILWRAESALRDTMAQGGNRVLLCQEQPSPQEKA